MSQNLFKLFDNSIKYFQKVGLWVHGERASRRDWIKFVAYLGVNFAITIMQIMYLINATDMADFVEAISTLPVMLGGFLKTLNFLFNQRKIVKCIQKLTELVENEKWIEKQNGSALLKRVVQIEKIFKVCLAVGLFGFAMSVFAPFFAHELPFKLWFPFDYHCNEILFWTSVLFENIFSFIVIPIRIVIETFPIYSSCRI